ncbi:MAG: hypothetical protein AMJ93_14330 [Anaerolineae bacterium SM23_84]|nr:MAG: hypothetical protein AMJ93_14330 [Anaerolineae bacterium SM23_84]
MTLGKGTSGAVVALILLGTTLAHGVAGTTHEAMAPAGRSPLQCSLTRAPGPEVTQVAADVPTLISRRAGQAPVVDGQEDCIWSCAVPLAIPLTWGRHGEDYALDVKLRSLYTEQAVYFLAEWLGDPPDPEQPVVSSRLTLHYDIPQPEFGAADRMCLVACHTAFTDNVGRLVYFSAQTIPPGRTDPLSAAGGWDDGVWKLEWSRELLVDNRFDLQFQDLDRSYPFFVKLFAWQEGRPDPASADCSLVFER